MLIKFKFQWNSPVGFRKVWAHWELIAKTNVLFGKLEENIHLIRVGQRRPFFSVARLSKRRAGQLLAGDQTRRRRKRLLFKEKGNTRRGGTCWVGDNHRLQRAEKPETDSEFWRGKFGYLVIFFLKKAKNGFPLKYQFNQQVRNAPT